MHGSRPHRRPSRDSRTISSASHAIPTISCWSPPFARLSTLPNRIVRSKRSSMATTWSRRTSSGLSGRNLRAAFGCGFLANSPGSNDSPFAISSDASRCRSNWCRPASITSSARGSGRSMATHKTGWCDFWSHFGAKPLGQTARSPFPIFPIPRWSLTSSRTPTPTLDSDPYVIIRPEGDWDRPGVLDISSDRMATSPFGRYDLLAAHDFKSKTDGFHPR